MNFEEETHFLNREIEKCKKELELKKCMVDENPTITKRIFIKYNNDGSVYSRTAFTKYNTSNKYYRTTEII
jgi:hypothetical protein